MEKAKFVKFRINDTMYEFLSELVRDMRKYDQRWNISEMMRMIVNYFFMAHMMGELRKPFSQIQKDFMEFARDTIPSRSSAKGSKQPL